MQTLIAHYIILTKLYREYYRFSYSNIAEDDMPIF